MKERKTISKIKQEKGITLITLVVTIIIILILAGVTINILFRENGLLEKVKTARIKYEQEDYREQIILIGAKPKVDYYSEKEENRSKRLIELYKEELENNKDNGGKLKESTIEWKNNDTVRVITKEGYVYDVTENETKYVGTKNEDVPPTLMTGDIISEIEPSGPTKGPVNVTFQKNPENEKIQKYKIEYSIDNLENWIEYTYPESITVNDNKTIIGVRLKNELGELGGYTTVEIQNIDRLQPKDFTPIATSTTNSITVTGKAEDADRTDKDGSSGIQKYYFSIDGGEWQPKDETGIVPAEDGDGSVNYTFNNLTQGTKHNVKMKAVDKAGNEKDGEEIIDVTVKSVAGIVSSDISIDYSNRKWTNTDVKVIVTLNNTDIIKEGNKLQWSENLTNWYDMTENPENINRIQNGAVYVRIADKNNQAKEGSYETAEVQNIDKEIPTGDEIPVTADPIAGSTTSSIKVETTVTDKEKTDTNGKSGIVKYWFSKDGGTTWEPTDGKDTSSHDFTGLEKGTSYNFKVKIQDEAGNVGISSVKEQSTDNNTAPDEASVSVTSKTTSAVNLSASATDTEGGILTYTIYWGTSSSNLSRETTKTATAGSEITYSKSSLTSYNLYYYRIDVADSDGLSTPGTVKSVRTYCPGGTTCSEWQNCTSGYSNKKFICSYCGGNGLCNGTVSSVWSMDSTKINDYWCDTCGANVGGNAAYRHCSKGHECAAEMVCINGHHKTGHTTGVRSKQ